MQASEEYNNIFFLLPQQQTVQVSNSRRIGTGQRSLTKVQKLEACKQTLQC